MGAWVYLLTYLFKNKYGMGMRFYERVRYGYVIFVPVCLTGTSITKFVPVSIGWCPMGIGICFSPLNPTRLDG